MSWKNEQIKEDKIEKLIESFQIKGKLFCFSKQNYNFTERWKRKRKTFLMRKNIILFTKKLKQFREQTI